MNYKLIIESENYALIIRGSKMEEYAVVAGLNKDKGYWDWTCIYCNFGSCSQLTQAQALEKAVDYFRMRTEKNYISRTRLEELATIFKDGLISDDRESAMEYFDDCCEMTEKEKEFFGIEESEEE